ncbi:MAG TPA: hypothetical protein VMB47_16840 [Candidatus Aquilonibacter sp.]|nr:hypothetical protein [Candidatus Aquilonibacter sp.]
MSHPHTRVHTAAIWSVTAFVIGIALGPGFIWQWKQSALADQKERLDFAIETTDLRTKEIDMYGQIVALADQYLQNTVTYSKTPSVELSVKMNQQQVQLNMLKDDFGALEGKLSALEGRQPRSIPLIFYPPQPPTDLRATVR